jgi:DNA-binding CsgD family transcriptional regulator
MQAEELKDMLSVREFEIFLLFGDGLSIKEVAGKLPLKRKTVETYRDRMRKKLKIESAHRLYCYAVRWVAENAKEAISASVCDPSQSVERCTPKTSCPVGTLPTEPSHPAGQRL